MIIMWDLKLYLSDIIFYIAVYFITFSNYVEDLINPLFFSGFTIFNNSTFYILPRNVTLIVAFKFVMTIMFLILIRGGTPRYRYDYLTKLGWLKFLSFIVILLIITLFFYFLF